MGTRNLLYKSEFEINDNIKIRIPTVGQILDDEDAYYGLVSMLTAMPIDMMVQLDDVGIDFTSIDEYELFLLLFEIIKGQDHSSLETLTLNRFRLQSMSKMEILCW